MSWAGPGLVCLSFFHDESGSGRNTFLFSRVVRLADTPDWSIFLLIWPTGAFWTSPVLINYPARFFQLLQLTTVYFPPFQSSSLRTLQPTAAFLVDSSHFENLFSLWHSSIKAAFTGVLDTLLESSSSYACQGFFFRRGSDLIDRGCVDFVDHNFFDLKVWALSHLIPAQSG